MMKIFAYPKTRATRILWTLEEMGVDYEYVLVDLRKGEGRKQPYIDLNPGGKVPTLVDGNLVLSESAAICTYLGDKYPAFGLVPACGTQQRALYNQWSFFVLSELEQPLWTIAKHRFALPEQRRVPEVIETAKWEFAKAAKVLNQGLDEQDFIVDNRFTVADVLVAHTLSWAVAFGLDLEHSRLDKYLQRMSSRPALAKAYAREQQG
jgi:glutathione S-transferase